MGSNNYSKSIYFRTMKPLNPPLPIRLLLAQNLENSWRISASENLRALSRQWMTKWSGNYPQEELWKTSFMISGWNWNESSKESSKPLFYLFIYILNSAVHSFILDTSDPEMKKLFTGQEWDEITRETELETTTLPESILNLIQEMNKVTDLLWFYITKSK